MSTQPHTPSKSKSNFNSGSVWFKRNTLNPFSLYTQTDHKIKQQQQQKAKCAFGTTMPPKMVKRASTKTKARVTGIGNRISILYIISKYSLILVLRVETTTLTNIQENCFQKAASTNSPLFVCFSKKKIL
ncbi:hypothetical protein Ddye_003779 [Dipteronia dyeriana]|uniref:Uncharacterized protein n=1 Tax=Dipteronia dyeriana TaxID=168575 RepID=A0AAD9XTD1_9ROSI|nr:hypothetical protein Ddye_003779 [Dipteronia dyeriana]